MLLLNLAGSELVHVFLFKSFSIFFHVYVSNDTNLAVPARYKRTWCRLRRASIRLATVFIGIWTAADSEMLSGLLLINYLVHNHSTNFFQGQQMIFQIHFTNFFTMFVSSSFNGRPVHVHVKQPQPHSVVLANIKTLIQHNDICDHTLGNKL